MYMQISIQTDVQTVQNLHDSQFLPKSAAQLQNAAHDHNMHLFKAIWRLLGVFSSFIYVILYVTISICVYFILSSEINAYQKQIKVISITSEMIYFHCSVFLDHL